MYALCTLHSTSTFCIRPRSIIKCECMYANKQLNGVPEQRRGGGGPEAGFNSPGSFANHGKGPAPLWGGLKQQHGEYKYK